jgi:polar amino acid transport system substrate-binding protein
MKCCLPALDIAKTHAPPSQSGKWKATLWMALSLGAGCHFTALAQSPNGPVSREKPVALVVDDWCPQHCQNSTTEKGYVVDIVTQALAIEGVPYSLQYVPWTRAMRMVEYGEADGLLTPTVPGFPQFLYHQQAVGYQQNCFYVDRESDWTFVNNTDLKGRNIAMLADSGLGATDEYLKANKDTIKVTELRGESDFAARLIQFLTSKRADTVILTSDVFQYIQAKGITGNRVKPAGCLDREKMAVGLSKVDATRSEWIGKALDRGIAQLRKSGQLAEILASYGMQDWDRPPRAKNGAVSSAGKRSRTKASNRPPR